MMFISSLAVVYPGFWLEGAHIAQKNFMTTQSFDRSRPSIITVPCTLDRVNMNNHTSLVGVVSILNLARVRLYLATRFVYDET